MGSAMDKLPEGKNQKRAFCLKLARQAANVVNTWAALEQWETKSIPPQPTISECKRSHKQLETIS